MKASGGVDRPDYPDDRRDREHSGVDQQVEVLDHDDLLDDSFSKILDTDTFLAVNELKLVIALLPMFIEP
jgi:hypothetical protein